MRSTLNNWVQGSVNGYHYQAVVFDTGSKYGIDNGPISKLYIWAPANRRYGVPFEESCDVVYDREWVKSPTSETLPIYTTIIDHINGR
ncbi:MAG TPA: hypothetical protein P5531_03910 [Bacteroidales bacterium]|nr:hypothetical protein [Bacteroidales bacterium]